MRLSAAAAGEVVELGAGVLIIAFALVVIVGLGMATRTGRRAVKRPGAVRPRLAVRLRRRRRRVADRVRTRWQAATTRRSTRSDESIVYWQAEYASRDNTWQGGDGSPGGNSSPSYDFGGGGSSDSGGGGGGGGGGD